MATSGYECRKKRVFLTGATGTMGMQAMIRILEHSDLLSLTVLVRDSKKNRKLMKRFQDRVEVIYGDLRDAAAVARGVADADYVLHVGGMVSPAADHLPELTMETNTGAARNIVAAVKDRPDKGAGVKVVYIGSVAQLGNRSVPHHWGRTGDPVWGAKFDVYALSKIEAEKIIVDSGIPHWVSLRQTGILANDLIGKASDPITFHVPVDGVLEWVTAEDSGRLMANICLADLPDTFWNRFYNIGGGEGFRLTNFEFEKLIMKTLSCPDPTRVFDADWFATRNFHGQWYEDSDLLEEYLHFRTYRDAEEFMMEFKKRLPFYFKLTGIVPAPLIKMVMKHIANDRELGTLSWIAGNNPERLKAYFGSPEEWRSIPSWSERDLSHPSMPPVRLNHGYDESVPESQIGLKELQDAARFRGGKCMAEDIEPGDIDRIVEWECWQGHRFQASPRLVLLGGHWCPECFGKDADYETEALHNPFFAQVWN